MKLLLFSDLHADSTAAHQLVQRAQTVDVLVGAGDFATARRNLQRCIEILRLVSCPTILVAGNNETIEELRPKGQSMYPPMGSTWAVPPSVRPCNGSVHG